MNKNLNNINIIDNNFKNLKINNNNNESNNNINFIDDENDCFNSILSLSSSPLPYQFTISSMMIPQSIPSSPIRIMDPKYSECPNAPMKNKSYIVPKYSRNNGGIRKRLSFSELDQDIDTGVVSPSPKVLKSKSTPSTQLLPSSPVQFIPSSSFRNIDNSCQVPELKKQNNRSRLVFF